MREMITHPVAGALGYDEIAKRVYGGDVLEFDGGGEPLVQAARDLIRGVFDVYDIEKAHEYHSKKAFLLLAAQAQHEFNQPRYRALFFEWLNHIGIDTGNDIYADALGLRIAPPVQTHEGGHLSHDGAHRDTWDTAIHEQINWWAPIMPLSYKRTLAFYPDHWTRPIENAAAIARFHHRLAAHNRARQSGRAKFSGRPQSKVQPISLPHMVRPRCGKMLAFSAAHLHSSVLNRTNRTRYSFEIKTVHEAHIHGDLGAPNVDCHPHPPLYHLFCAITDSTLLLRDVLAAKGLLSGAPC